MRASRTLNASVVECMQFCLKVRLDLSHLLLGREGEGREVELRPRSQHG